MRLGQPFIEEPYGRELTPDEMQSFQTDYSRLLSIWPAFLDLRNEIAATRNEFVSKSNAAKGAGDTATGRTFDAAASRLSDMLSLHASTVATVNGWRSTWESVKDAMLTGGEWYGFPPGGIAGLGTPGVVVATSGIAAIAALAVVMNRYLTLRSQLDREREILAKIDSGQITPSQGAELIRAGAPTGFFSGLLGAIGSTPLSWAILIGGGLLVAYQIRGLR